MKPIYFLFILFLATTHSKPLTEADRNRISRECIAEVGIDKSVIEYAVGTLDLPNSQEYKDFLFCSYKKQKYQKANGEFIPENLIDFLSKFYDKKDASKIVDQCMGIEAKNSPELSFLTLKCLLKHLLSLEAVTKKLDVKDSDFQAVLTSTDNTNEV